METGKSIAALLFILLIAGINLMMYGVIRGMTRSNKNNILEMLSKSFNPSASKKDDDMRELRRILEELEKGKKADTRESKP